MKKLPKNFINTTIITARRCAKALLWAFIALYLIFMVKWPRLLDTFLSVDWRFMTVLIILSFLYQLCLAQTTFLLMKLLGCKISFTHVFKTNYASISSAYFSQTAGTIHRLIGLSGKNNSKTEIMYIMLYERSQIFLICFILLFFYSFLSPKSTIPSPFIIASYIYIFVFIVMCAICIGLKLSYESNVVRISIPKWSELWLQKLMLGLSKIRSIKWQEHFVVLLPQFCITIIMICQYLLLSRMVGHPIDLSLAIFLYAFMRLLESVPILAWGMGLQDGFLIVFLPSIGLTHEVVVIWVAIVFSNRIIQALIGLFFWMSLKQTPSTT